MVGPVDSASSCRDIVPGLGIGMLFFYYMNSRGCCVADDCNVNDSTGDVEGRELLVV